MQSIISYYFQVFFFLSSTLHIQCTDYAFKNTESQSIWVIVIVQNWKALYTYEIFNLTIAKAFHISCFSTNPIFEV